MKYPHTYHTIVNNPHACDNDVYIVIGSPVGPSSVRRRDCYNVKLGATFIVLMAIK